jgi:hypothetical protein
MTFSPSHFGKTILAQDCKEVERCLVVYVGATPLNNLANRVTTPRRARTGQFYAEINRKKNKL